MPKKKPKGGKPQVHDDLKGLEININSLGEITSNITPEKMNKFLDKNVEDKKLKQFEEPLEEAIEEEEDTLENMEEEADLENLKGEEE